MLDLITLVPNTAIQFVDLDLAQERLANRRRVYWEEPFAEAPTRPGEQQVVLRELTSDLETGELVDPRTGRAPPADEVYAVGRSQALEPFLEKWIPLPCLLVRGRDKNGDVAFERGPSTWARGRLVSLPGREGMLRLTLAFDTALLEQGSGPFLAPGRSHAELRQEFGFPAGLDQLAWFLREPWVDLWLSEMFDEFLAARTPGRPPPPRAHVLEHIARFVALLDLLGDADMLPRVQLIDTVSANVGYKPVLVDLVLDIGHARTCGLLIEQHPGEGMDLADSYPLKLRDLSRPEWVHEKPFDSHVEFARASFGRDAAARRAGRPLAFHWPSPLRVGPEAVRLSGLRRGNEGATGLTSPKRYLWDERPSQQSWRYLDPGEGEVDPVVRGPHTAFIANDGTVLRTTKGKLNPATRARYSRSAMFTFMLTEILMQALCQINAPATREARRDKITPRQLRRVLLTLPPGMPVHEQAILRKRAEAAVLLAWDLLGWTEAAGAPPQPRIVIRLDEASATQIVWLHNEVAERFAGDAKALFARLGRSRRELGAEHRLRVASLDIGGGTTDLMVVTYSLPAGESIRPAQEFRESTKIAGDDVLERVVVQVILPCLERALAAAGAAAPRDVLIRTLGQNLSDQSEQDRQKRRTFVGHALEPLAIAILGAAEAANGADGEIFRRRLGDLLPAELGAPERITRTLDEAAVRAGAQGFRAVDAEIVADNETVTAAVRGTLMPVLADLCEATWHYDCDVLLLSGRPSRLPAVLDIILAKSPVPVHRVVPMHRYRVGRRYPFRDTGNRIEDPKTTAVVGAMLFVLAEGQIANFALDPKEFRMRSTARVIGRMNNDGQILEENVLLKDLDLDAKPAATDGFTLRFQTRTRIGFRQLDTPRWTSTPLYVMEFTNPDIVGRYALPLSVRVERNRDPDAEAVGPDQSDSSAEKFSVVEVLDATGGTQVPRDVTLRLQTIDREDGYWRDTGLLGMS